MSSTAGPTLFSQDKKVNKMKNKSAILALVATALAGTMFAGEGAVPKGVPPLNRVFLIMMENHGFSQIFHNPNAPFTNRLARSANTATNFFAVGHPSLTNYLEVVGGSNFGVRSDNSPDWHNTGCTPDIVGKTVSTDTPASPDVCPIAGTGTDAETPVLDTTNEVSGPPGLVSIDGRLGVPAAPGMIGKTIADQLVAAGRRWKTYQESIPLTGVDLVNYSDGVYTDKTDFSMIKPALNPPLSQGDVVKLYAAKHNPFVYFANVQDGSDPRLSLRQVRDFEGPNGLFADLASGNVQAFSFIAPNQCNDQHGRGNAGAFCNFDPASDGEQSSLNPALIHLGDIALQRIVNAIKQSPAWKDGNNAIVVMWDENDYSNAPNINRIMTIVDTSYGVHGVQSGQFYTHFSLLKSLEAGFGLPCLNHACDEDAKVMSDLFAKGSE
jgi:hypothetical protein